MEQQHYGSSRSLVDNQCHESLSFNVMLRCTKTDQTEHKEIKFKCPPLTTLDVKRQVEKQYNVPMCIQVLSYEDHPLEDDVKLSALRVRHGDTFHVRYLVKGHCSEINDIIAWMNSLSAALKRENPSVYEQATRELYEVVIKGLGSLEVLAFSYFSPWLDPVTRVNKFHFVYNGGVEVIMEIYAALLRRPWPECALIVKHIEHWVLKVLCTLVENVSVRRLVTRNMGLQMCIQSLLRVKLEEGKRIEDYEPSRDQRSLLLETYFAGVATLANLVELPECRMEVASAKDLLHQLTCIPLIRGLRRACPQIVAMIFLTLAYTPKTHEYIADPIFTKRLLEAYRYFPGCGFIEEEETILPKYFTLVFLAQVALVSPQYVTADCYQLISNEMELLLQKVNYKTIKDLEIKGQVVWVTVVPYVKLAYIPNAPQEEGPVTKLQLLSLQLILFALQNMLGRENHREVMLKEDLLDYVTCMPQHVPSSLRPQAEELVQMVTSFPDISEGPPKLLNIVKARLAKMHFGLEQVLSLSVSEIVSSVLPMDIDCL